MRITFKIYILILLSWGIFACQNEALQNDPDIKGEPSDISNSSNVNQDYHVDERISALEILSPTTESLTAPSPFELTLRVTWADGSMTLIPSTQRLQDTNEDNYDVVWYSNDPDRLELDSVGRFTIHESGSVLVTASVLTKSASLLIDIPNPSSPTPSPSVKEESFEKSDPKGIIAIDLSHFPSSCTEGEFISLHPLLTREDGSQLTPQEVKQVLWLNFESSDESKAIIRNQNLFCRSAGRVTVTATLKDLRAQKSIRIFSSEENILVEEEFPSESHFLQSSDPLTAHLGAPLTDITGEDLILSTPDGDVMSIGRGGEIILELDGRGLMDGNGVDFIIYENAFQGWYECAEVSVSSDNQNFYTFPCQNTNESQDTDLCAGYEETLTHLDPEDYLSQRGSGDTFDLANLNLEITEPLNYIKIVDKGVCGGTPEWMTQMLNGFDLDAITLIHLTSAPQ